MERLIGSLFETLADPDWASPFLSGVCAATQSHAAAVLEVDLAARRQRLPAFFGQGPEMANAFEQTHASGNPWRPRDERQGPPTGSVVVPDDVLPIARLRKTSFWSDFLRPMDVDHGSGIIGRRTADRVVSLTLLRSSRRGPYGNDERNWLASLAPHWVNACALRQRLTPPDRDTWGTARTFDAVGTAAFLLDDRGRCMRWNAAGEALLRGRGMIGLRGGRLLAVHRDTGSPFLGASGPTVLRHRDGSVAGHAAAHSLPGHGPLGGARSVVFVEPVDATSPRDLRQALVAAYGLTPREAELAERLSTGMDVKQVAAAMRVSVEGARTRLKSAYGKTETRHQGALVSLVRSLRSVLGPSG